MSGSGCSVFYSMFAFVLMPGLVSLLRTHAQHMLSSILLSFPLSLPFSHLATASTIPISCVLCVRVCDTNRHNSGVTRDVFGVVSSMIYLRTWLCIRDRVVAKIAKLLSKWRTTAIQNGTEFCIMVDWSRQHCADSDEAQLHVETVRFCPSFSLPKERLTTSDQGQSDPLCKEFQGLQR